MASTLPRPRTPSRITCQASCCRCAWAPGGRTGRGLFWGKAAFAGYGLGGLVRVWLSLVWERYLVPSLPSARAAAAPGEALGARAGPVPRTSGIVRAAA